MIQDAERMAGGSSGGGNGMEEMDEEDLPVCAPTQGRVVTPSLRVIIASLQCC